MRRIWSTGATCQTWWAVRGQPSNSPEARGEPVDAEAMRKEVAERDRADSQRTVAPLRPAEDAIILDTDNLDLEQAVDRVLSFIKVG